MAPKPPNHLFERPFIGAPAAAKHLGVTARTAKLLQAGLLQEATGRSCGRLYLVARITDAIDTLREIEQRPQLYSDGTGQRGRIGPQQRP